MKARAYVERLFGQVKRIAENTSNRKLENILPNILLRLEAIKQNAETYLQNITAKAMPSAKMPERSALLKIVWGGTLHAERGYTSRWQWVRFTLRGGTLHAERGYTSRWEGVHFTLRGGTLHVERGYTSRWEWVHFTLRGDTLHVERGYTSRWEGVHFTLRGGRGHYSLVKTRTDRKCTGSSCYAFIVQ